MRNMISAMCYTEKATGKSYLAYVSYDTIDNVKKEADRLNNERPSHLRTFEPARCDERIYWAQEQEEF